MLARRRVPSARWPTPRVGRSWKSSGQGELSAGEIAARFPISGPSVSRHLGVLKTAG
jgi:DNA-binding transcriptional ArsR family regulator